MLALLVTGVIVHRRIFTDFFTFRPNKAPARSWLDAHNVSSVMTLPFALMITYLGLVIPWGTLMPAGGMVVGREAMQDETRPALDIPKDPGDPAPTLPLWSFFERAQSGLTAGQTLRRIQVFHPGGTQTQVRVSHADDALLWGGGEKIFHGATGELLRHETNSASAACSTQVLHAMHEIRFAGPLRWLYFLMSAGCLRDDRHGAGAVDGEAPRQGVETSGAGRTLSTVGLTYRRSAERGDGSRSFDCHGGDVLEQPAASGGLAWSGGVGNAGVLPRLGSCACPEIRGRRRPRLRASHGRGACGWSSLESRRACMACFPWSVR
jgi:hypothetical protein